MNQLVDIGVPSFQTDLWIPMAYVKQTYGIFCVSVS